MIVLVAVLATVFYLRDYLLLRMGPAKKIPRRVVLYLGATFAAISVSRWVVVQFLTADAANKFGPWNVVILALILHFVIGGLCLWMKCTDRHHWAWTLSIVPVPVLWLGLAVAALPGYQPSGLRRVEPWVWLVPLVLAFTTARAAFARRRQPMEVDDLDFALDLSGWSNLLIVWILPVVL